MSVYEKTVESVWEAGRMCQKTSIPAERTAPAGTDVPKTRENAKIPCGQESSAGDLKFMKFRG